MSMHREDYVAEGNKIVAWVKEHQTVSLSVAAFVVGFLLGKLF